MTAVGALFAVFTLLFLTSCDLNTPPAPVHDSPWDPDNPDPPRAPSDLSGIILSETSIHLQWRDASGNEEGFRLYQTADGVENPFPALTFEAVTDTARTMTAAFDNLSANVLYEYRVEAVNGAGVCDNPPTIRLNTGQVKPFAPGGLQIEIINESTVLLTWTDHSEVETGFILQLSVGDSLHFSAIDTLEANLTSAPHTGLDPFTTCYYRLKAVNSYGESDFTGSVWATTGNFPLSTPRGLTASALSESEIELIWTAAPPHALRVDLYQSVGDSLNFTPLESLPPFQTERVIEVEPGVDYFFKIRYSNDFVQSALSSAAYANTRDAPPTRPINLWVHLIDEDAVQLDWQDRSQIETGYVIQMSKADTLSFVAVGGVPTDRQSFTVQGLELNLKHYFRIRAIGRNRNSPYSASVEAIPGHFPPRAPSNMRVTALSTTEVLLEWDDNSRIETSFEAQRRMFGHAWVAFGGAPADSLSLSGGNLTPGTVFEFRVRAKNDYGASAYSQKGALTMPTMPAAPTNFSAEGISFSEIELIWRDASDNEDGFIVQQSLTARNDFLTLDTLESIHQNYIVPNCQQFTRYYFRVCAYNRWGNSAWTAVDSAMAVTPVALVAAGDAGLLVIDVSDPASPRQMGSWDTPGIATKVKTYGDYAYVADSYGGLRVINIANPRSPKEAGFLESEGRAYGLDVARDRVYIANGENGLLVVNVANPALPLLNRSLPLEECNAREVRVQGTYAYVAAGGGGLRVIEAPSQGFLEEVDNLSFPSAAYGLCVANNRAYVAAYAAGLRVCDVTSPEQISEMGCCESPNTAIAALVEGSTVYVANYWGGLSIVDVTSPSSPTEISSLATHGQAWDLAKLDTYLYIADHDGGLMIVDVSSAISPREVGSLNLGSAALGVAVKEYK